VCPVLHHVAARCPDIADHAIVAGHCEAVQHCVAL
jgi:hypothetical protein